MSMYCVLSVIGLLTAVACVSYMPVLDSVTTPCMLNQPATDELKISHISKPAAGLMACLHVIALAYYFVVAAIRSACMHFKACSTLMSAHSSIRLQGPGNMYSISCQSGIATAREELAAGGGSS